MSRHGRLPVIDQQGNKFESSTDRDGNVGWQPVAGLPAGGRDACRGAERPCPHVACEHHLWTRDDRRGGDREARMTLEPRWLEEPTPACCELDIIENDPAVKPMDVTMRINGVPFRFSPARSTTEIADALGVTPRQVQKIITMALKKLGTNEDAKELLLEILRRSAVADRREG